MVVHRAKTQQTELPTYLGAFIEMDVELNKCLILLVQVVQDLVQTRGAAVSKQYASPTWSGQTLFMNGHEPSHGPGQTRSIGSQPGSARWQPEQHTHTYTDIYIQT